MKLRRLSLLTAAAGLVSAGLALGAPPANAVTCTGTAWAADYLSNMTLAGNPVLSRCDAAINNDWGLNSPGAPVPVDNFSARWTRTINFTAGEAAGGGNASNGFLLGAFSGLGALV